MAMERVAPPLLGECLQTLFLRNACPTLVPREPTDAVGSHASVFRARGADRWDVLDLGWGGENPRSPQRNRPEHFLHMTIMAGDLGGAFPFDYPASGHAPPLNEVQIPSTEPIWFGPRDWGGRKGTLILAPSFEEGGGIQGGHLIFRWSSGGTDYAVGLHAWTPLERTAATLRRVVEGISER